MFLELCRYDNCDLLIFALYYQVRNGKEAMEKNVMFDLLMFLKKEKPQECFIYSLL